MLLPIALAFLAGLALGSLTATPLRRSLDTIRRAALSWRAPRDIEIEEMGESEMTEILEAHDPAPTPPRLRRAK